MIVEIASPAKSVFILGDSHVLKYRNRVFQTEHSKSILLQDIYIRGISPFALNDLVKSGSLQSALQRTTLYGSTGRLWHQELPKYKAENIAADFTNLTAPVVVLFMGEIALREYLKSVANKAGKTDFINVCVQLYESFVVQLNKKFKINIVVHLLDPPTSSKELFLKVNQSAVDLLELGQMYECFNDKLLNVFGNQNVIDYTKTVRAEKAGSYNLHRLFEGDGCHASRRVGALFVRELIKTSGFNTLLP
jgi:hypothetical protein